MVGEVNGLTLNLVARIQHLGERYAETVSDLETELEKLEAKRMRYVMARSGPDDRDRFLRGLDQKQRQ